MDDGAAPLAAADLLGGTDTETDTVAAEEGVAGTAVDAQIEVQVGAVLVGGREGRLGAQRVAVRRAQVGDLDDDAVAGVGDRLAAAVLLDGQSPAGSTGWTGTGAL